GNPAKLRATGASGAERGGPWPLLHCGWSLLHCGCTPRSSLKGGRRDGREKLRFPRWSWLRSASRLPVRPGDVVDERFAIERFAAVGGMGAVYRGRDLRTDLPVALKVLRNEPLHEDVLRFEREALALAELDHPGIVRHVAHGATAEGLRYLAM